MAMTKFRAPALPLPGQSYDQTQVYQLIRALQLYFNQLDSLTPIEVDSVTAANFVGGEFFGDVEEPGEEERDTGAYQRASGSERHEGELLAELAEERRSCADTHGIDKKCEPQRLHDGHIFPKRGVNCRESETYE